jgi:DNA polymerase-4
MPPPIRKIIHVDMDAFYASVEQRDRPELRGRPVIVGGNPKGRGVVATASYEAREFGIHSAMPCAQAARLCPNAVFLKPDFARYKAVSAAIRAIFLSITPLVEPLSLDEAYLDVTENNLNEPLAGRIALDILSRISNELGLSASAGVGPNKFIAKVASDIKKPGGCTIIPPARVDVFVAELPIEKLWGVGPSTANKLHEMNIYTGADLRGPSMQVLEERFGKQGRFMYALARGEDSRRVQPHRMPKSRGAESTFSRNIIDVPLLLEKLQPLCKRVDDALCRIDRWGRTVTLKVRYGDFQTETRSRTLSDPVREAGSIYGIAERLLREQTRAGERPVRLIGVSVGNLVGKDDPRQMGFDFDD